jgi:predicted phage terminase large subunit-like protein
VTQAIRPQPGPQETFLASPADIVIYGGAAGGGKSYGLLLEPLRHVEVKGFGAVIFRREAVQITSEGGLWDTAMSIYPSVGGRPRSGSVRNFVWPSGAKVTFWHLHNDAAVLDWQGSQIPLIGFDELTHFSRYQFFYMLSRNRSACGVRPYVRATTNPDADSWVAGFIEWWIDQKTGYPIAERSGVVRWFVRVNDVMQWGDSKEDLADRYGAAPEDCKSVTFIAANIDDNQALLKADPGYRANLKALSRVERERLLGGNWKIRPSAGLYFNRAEVEVIDAPPTDVIQWVRSWDFAATEPGEGNDDPDWTAGVKMGRTASGKYVISHLAHDQLKSDKVRKLVRNIATQDGNTVRITVPQDPGQAGKAQAYDFVTMLAGYPAFRRAPSRDKVTRAEPFAAQWQAGNVQVVRGPWNETMFAELEGFPSASNKAHDDIVDACSDAFAELQTARPIPTALKVNSL